MKKVILFSLFILSTSILQAQTGGTEGNNDNGQAPPTYQNPYGTNPYGTNPYGTNPNDKKNMFDNSNKDKNTNDPNSNPSQPDNKPDVDPNTLDFSDRNEVNKGKTDAELREMYKNDPDYLKYIGVDPNAENDPNVEENEPIDPTNLIYGSNFLSTGIGSAGTNNLTTVPEDYRLGVGDEIVITVWGAAEFQNPFTISKDGSIFPSRVGKIFLQGLSFQAARNVIQSKFKKVLPAGSNVDIVMGKVRTIRVYMYGEVKKAGMITMSALNTPINALQLAGGLNEFGNMRDIQIRRNGMIIERIDLYEYLKNGNNGREFYMQDNDIITVGLYEKIVQASGAFKRPMRYQLTKYGTLTDLIELAGGVKYNARESLIRVKTVTNEKEKIQDFNGKDLLEIDYVLQDGDVVTVNEINEGISNIVSISGPVSYPDQYQINNGDRIFDLIKKAGGLVPSAYKPRAFVFRKGATADKSRTFKVDLRNYGIQTDSLNNIVVESGDSVRILSEARFDEKFFVSVKGLVRTPGNIQYKPNMRLKDVLLMSGGLELEAENGRIEISNITDSVNRYSITGNNVNVRVVSINPDLSIDAISENIIIKPYDMVFVRKKKDILEQKLVSIAGEVDYAGEYALLSEKDRITSLIIRSGGLKKEAFPEAAKLIRKNYGAIVINLKDAMRNAGGKDDIILEEGDLIIIPKKDEIVKVTGNVQIPINIKFDKDKRSVLNYIDAAGGFGERPWRRRISVKYQNGRLKRTKSFLFVKFYPKVKSGSTINVPVRPESDKVDLNEVLKYGISTATSIATIIVLVNSLNNNP